MHSPIAPVPLAQAYKLINHGPATLVSARHEGVSNVMAASWVCALDFSPPKLTAVLDKATRTRALAEGSGLFVIQVPTVAQLALTHRLGHHSMNDDPHKLARCGVELQQLGDMDLPFVVGCSAWLACRIVPEPHIQNTFDLFIADVVAAWADTRAFSEGRWHFSGEGADLRSLHYIAGGRFHALGEAMDVSETGSPKQKTQVK